MKRLIVPLIPLAIGLGAVHVAGGAPVVREPGSATAPVVRCLVPIQPRPKDRPSGRRHLPDEGGGVHDRQRTVGTKPVAVTHRIEFSREERRFAGAGATGEPCDVLAGPIGG